MSLPAVSKHLKVLERAGLILRGREAQWRPCRIEPRALKEVDEWLERYRRFWEQSFDRLDDYLRELQAKEKKDGRKKKPSAATQPGDRALRVTRVFDAPRASCSRRGRARSISTNGAHRAASRFPIPRASCARVARGEA